MNIVAVVGDEILAGSGRKTLLPLAHAVFLLLLAGRVTEVRGGSSDVVDIPLEARILRQLDRFLVYAVLAAGLHPAPLVERDGAEVTKSKAAAVVGYRELHLLDSRDSSLLLIHRVVHAHVGQLIGVVKLRLGNASLRRILHQHLIAVALDYRPAVHLVLLIVLLTAGFRVRPLVVPDYLEAVALHRADGSVLRLGEVAYSAQVMHVP